MKTKTAILSLSVVLLFLLSLTTGSVSIPVSETVSILTGGEPARESWKYIILYSRLPQAVTALMCGAALSASGLMLQTTFANPLAGPSILGISSGASLGVALVMLLLGGSVSIGALSLSGFIAVAASALIGSMLMLGIMLLFSSFVKSNTMLLIIGIMVGYIASSTVALLNFFSTAEGVQSYVIWGLGNFSGVSSPNLPFFTLTIIAGLVAAIMLCKELNTLLLGENYAENLGLNLKRTRALILLTIGVLTSVTTAFCGPISFIGLAVPHIARLIVKSSNHNRLMPITILCGAAIALACNLICSIPCPGGMIPINAITPVFGAPVIIYVIIRPAMR